MLQNLNTVQDALTIFFDQRASLSSHTDSEGVGMEVLQKNTKSYLGKMFSEGECLYVDQTEMMSGRELLDFTSPKVRLGEVVIPASRKLVFCYYLYLAQLSEEWVEKFFEAETEYWKFNQAANYSDYQYIIALCFRANTILEEQRSKYTQILRLLAEKNNHNGILNRQVILLRVSGYDDYSKQEQALILRLYLMSRRNSVHWGGTGDSGIHMLNYMDYYENRASECLERIEEIKNWIEVPVDPDFNDLSEQLNGISNSVFNQLEDIRKRFSIRSRIYPVRIDQFRGNYLTGFRLSESTNNPRLVKRKKEFIEKEKERILDDADFSSINQLIDTAYHYPDREALSTKHRDGSLKAILIGRETQDQKDNARNNIYTEYSIKEGIYSRIEKILKKTAGNNNELLETKKTETRSLQKIKTEAGRYAAIVDCFDNIAVDIIPMEAHWRPLVEKSLIALISGSPAQNWDIRGYAIRDIDRVYRFSKISPCEIAVLLEYNMVPIDDSMNDTMNMLY